MYCLIAGFFAAVAQVAVAINRSVQRMFASRTRERLLLKLCAEFRIGRSADHNQRLAALRAFRTVKDPKVVCHRCTPYNLRYFIG